jgi:hypothetical protein
MRARFIPLSIWTDPRRNRELWPRRQRFRRGRRENEERFRAMLHSLERFPFGPPVETVLLDEDEEAERVYLN